MNESFWGIGVIVFGLLAILLVNFISNIGTNNELDYYAIKEVTEAAMVDAFDYDKYQWCLTMPENAECAGGPLSIAPKRFVENFTKRLANVAGGNRTYTIQFLEIVDQPPRVRINVISEGSFDIGTMRRVQIENEINAMLIMKKGGIEVKTEEEPEAYLTPLMFTLKPLQKLIK